MTLLVRTAADILAEIHGAEQKPAPVPIALVDDPRPLILRWEDPPPRDPRANHRPPSESKYALIIETLRLRPGDWALVYVGDKERATNFADAIRLGRNGAGFQATTRTVDGETRTYARYVGGAS